MQPRENTVELDRISDYPGHWASRRPESEAMVLGDERWTWRAFAQSVDRTAAALIASGVKRGDRVAMLATPCPTSLIAFLAAARIGAMWTGLNLRLTLDELAYVVGDAEPVLLITLFEHRGRDYQDDIRALAARVPSIRQVVSLGRSVDGLAGAWAEFLDGADAVDAEAFSSACAATVPDDPVLLIYTSGSTGRSKGAMLSHRGLAHCLRNQSDFWWAEPLRVLNNLPISNVFCIGDLFCWTMIGGGTTIFMERFDAAEILRTIERERVTVWGQVPTMLQLALAEQPSVRADLSSLQFVFWAGARAPHDLIAALARLAPKLSTNYGLTETVAGVTYVAEGASFEELAETVGRPHPSYELRIVGSDDRVLGDGEEGEIQIRGQCKMVGYWRRPEATAAAFTEDGWMRSGDTGLRRADGNYRIVGRLSDMFKSGGFNVYPREIELVLEAHGAVTQAAVVGVPDPLFGEVGWAFVQTSGAVDDGTLDAWCRERLANFKVPKRIEIVADLPLVAVGKIDKPALRRRALQQGETQ